MSILIGRTWSKLELYSFLFIYFCNWCMKSKRNPVLKIAKNPKIKYDTVLLWRVFPSPPPSPHIAVRWTSNTENHKCECWHTFTVNITGAANRLLIVILCFLTLHVFCFYIFTGSTMRNSCSSGADTFSWLPVILQLLRASSEKSQPMSDCLWQSALSLRSFLQGLLSVDVNCL